MDMHHSLDNMFIAFLIVLPLASGMVSNEISPSLPEYCPPEQTVCEFFWTVENKQTMIWYDGVIGYPVIWRNGSFYARGDCEDEPDKKLNMTEIKDIKKVIPADGTYKYIQTVNEQLPGPSVVVYEGQEVVIKVKNNFWQQGIGIHWHGVVQKNTNWMDGVPSVTQCAINPKETFTYRFYADPVGTHWYHSHEGLQRNDGLFGAFIVLPDPKKTKLPNHPEPTYHKDFIMTLTDWFPSPANNMMTSVFNDMKKYLYDRWNSSSGDCFGSGGKTSDGKSAGQFKWHSGLINGKGFVDDGSGLPKIDVPLETYMVSSNQYYRFRVINGGATYQLKVSVDNHPLTVIASDGQDITPVQADSFILASGERFDFYIYTNQTVGNYWIRAMTLEVDQPHQTLAILRYSAAPATNPTTSQTCMGANCVVVNCPFSSFIRGPDVNSTCVNFESLTSRVPSTLDTNNFKEHFIGFVEPPISVFNDDFDTINGVMFVMPSTPPASIAQVKYDENCATRDCSNGPCRCTNQINLNLGDTVQLVMMANESHPVHLHGHWFEVLKVAYPPPGHDKKFKALMSNQDVACNNDYCNQGYWTNKTWDNKNIPGTNLINPPKKDTLSIPAWGYVVIRFKVDNPGWWLMHCHIEKHMHVGMAILFQSGTESQMKKPPKGFPTCGSFHLNQADFKAAMNPQAQPTTTSNPTGMTDGFTDREKNFLYGYIGVALAGIIVGIIVHIAYVSCRKDD